MSQLVEDLRASRALLVEKGRCTRGEEGPGGEVCLIAAWHDSCVRPAYDASDRTTVDMLDDRYDAWRTALMAQAPEGFLNVIDWNQHPDTTDEAVLDAWDRAIATAEEKDEK